MWTAEYTIVTDASKESIWRAWVDVEGWKIWEEGVEWCSMDGAFKKETSYKLKPKGGPEAKAIITDCQPMKSFADVFSLSMAKMEFAHELRESQDGLHVTHRITISGLLGFLFVQVIGKDTARDFPKTISNLIRIAKVDYQ
jgi:hypothetical protein